MKPVNIRAKYESHCYVSECVSTLHSAESLRNSYEMDMAQRVYFFLLRIMAANLIGICSELTKYASNVMYVHF